MSFLDLLENILQSPGASARQPTSGAQPSLPRLEPVPKGSGEISDVLQSVVQIVALRGSSRGGMSSAWTGSGTIVHPQGIILTNCHVAYPRAMGMPNADASRMGISMTEHSDSPPALTYFAETVAWDADLDLAVMRIVSDIKGRRLSRLSLPAVTIGDSNSLELGDRISIFGYPGIGGDTVTFTSGNVSGFSRDREVSQSRAWIKTDATISGGNSGGTAVNEHGLLVGIPTQAAAGTGVNPVDARPVLDTNHDGRVDRRDTPMAVGGFINGLRPVNLAIDLLKKAGMQISNDRDYRKPASTAPADVPRHTPQPIPGFEFDKQREKPTFSNLLFSTRVTDDGRPIHPTDRLPSGVDKVYASFDYDAMQHGLNWSAVWINDGKIIIEQKDRWDDPEQGRKTVKIANTKGIPDGTYNLALGIGETVALEGEMAVGKAIDESDSEISGRLVDANSGRPVSGGVVIVLKAEASLEKFLRSRDERYVLTSTETARDGKFTLPQQLPKGEAYSLIAAANGYHPLTVERALRISHQAPELAYLGNLEIEPA